MPEFLASLKHQYLVEAVPLGTEFTTKQMEEYQGKRRGAFFKREFDRYTWTLQKIPIDLLHFGQWKPSLPMNDSAHREDIPNKKHVEEDPKTWSPDEKQARKVNPKKAPPVVALKRFGRYQLIDGRHRSRAAFLAGLTHVLGFVGEKITGEKRELEKKYEVVDMTWDYRSREWEEYVEEGWNAYPLAKEDGHVGYIYLDDPMDKKEMLEQLTKIDPILKEGVKHFAIFKVKDNSYFVQGLLPDTSLKFRVDWMPEE